MPQPDRVVIAHDKPLTVHVIVRSKSLKEIRYKLWSRRSADDQWHDVGEGIRVDDGADDRFELGTLRAGSALAYWFEIGGQQGTRYQFDLAFLQDGRLLPGGLCGESGQFSEDELNTVQSRLVFP